MIPDISKLKAIFKNEQHLIESFIPDELMKAEYEDDYTQSGIVKTSIKMHTNMVAVDQAKFIFSDPALQTAFDQLREGSDINRSLEAMVDEIQAYGNAYLQTVKDDQGVYLYNIDPEIVEADYNQYNTQERAKKYTIKITKKQDNETYTLLTHYYDDRIEIEAENSKNEKVDPAVAFMDILEGIEAVKKKDMYIVYTGLDYSILQHARLTRPSDQFYGRSMIHKGISSKLSKLNRMYNLANKAIGISADPKIELTEETGKLIQSVIDDVTSTKKTITVEDVGSLDQRFGTLSARSTSMDMSKVGWVINKKLAYYVNSGRGENKYLVNTYSLADLFTLIEKLEQQIRSELYISPALVDPAVTTGAKSGIAYKRLMENTIKHVEDVRMAITPTLKKVASNLANMANGGEYNPILPRIEWQPIVEDEMSVAEKLNTRLNGGNNQ